MLSRPPIHTMPFMYPALIVVSTFIGGVWTWSALLLGGVVLPAYELIEDDIVYNSNASRSSKQGNGTSLLVFFVLIEILSLLIVLYAVSLGRFTTFETLGLALSLGAMTGGVGIPVAHELIHRRSRFLQWTGMVPLAAVIYMHFRVEHLSGHHANVGTRNDPATARRGESVWAFLVRSVVGQYRSAWRLERKRLRGRTALARVLSNTVIACGAVQVLIFLAIWNFLGSTSLLVFAGQAVFAVMVLEFINYIEHYGLVRKMMPDGRREPVASRHSWTTDAVVTNGLAFNLGRHAHHHRRPVTPYPKLLDDRDAPRLPAGYLAMIAIASVPPLWRTVIHPRLDDYEARRAAGKEAPVDKHQ